MSIAVTCSRCGKSMRVKDSLADTRGTCPFCKGEIQIPQATVAGGAASVPNAPADPFSKPARPVSTPARAEAAPPAPGGTGEGTVYADPEVMVTSARVICGGNALALRDVTSAKMQITPANRVLGILIVVFGAVLALVGMFLSHTNALDEILAWAGPAVVLGAGIWTLVGDTPDFHVAITGSAGEVRAFTSKDRARVERIVGAVNDAIVKYR